MFSFLLQWLYLVSTALMLGTTLGSAFYLFAANRTRDAGIMYFACKYGTVSAKIFTAPAIGLHLFSGLVLLGLSPAGLDNAWALALMIATAVAVLCWLPVAWIQAKMRDMLAYSLVDGAAPPPLYWRYERGVVLLYSIFFPFLLFALLLVAFRPV